VNVVIGTLELTTIGGVGTYLVTVAEQLERAGHAVTIATEESGTMAAIAAERGLRVVEKDGELPEDADLVYAQDAPSAYRLAERYREAPQVFCVHATEHDRWVVPQLPGLTGATVALHERAARYARSLAHVPEVLRLRQPVDSRRFTPRGPIGERPRRALVLGNYLSGNRLELIRDACSDAGIELVERGLRVDDFTLAPEMEMNDCDFVIGKSRVIVEAMACGRAAYVYDHNGGDGWVTPERYADLEADNFDGQSGPAPCDADRVRRDLLAYRPEMGATNRELAVVHHGATPHCEQLMELFRRVAPRSEPASAPLEELGRLTRTQWQTDSRALAFEHEAGILRTGLAQRTREGTELAEETARARQRAAEAEKRANLAEVEARRAVARLERMQGMAAGLRAVQRAASTLGRPFRLLSRARRTSR
jgi:hypothetical protein